MSCDSHPRHLVTLTPGLGWTTRRSRRGLRVMSDRPATMDGVTSSTAVAPPPPFSASAAEQICRILADAVTGSQIPNLIGPLKAPEAGADQQNTKWKRLFNAVATAQNRQQDGRPLLRLISEVMRPVRFSTPAEFEERRRLLNERLLLSGFEVAEDRRKGHRPRSGAG